MRIGSRLAFVAVVAVALLLAGPGNGQAADYYWNTASGTWLTGANWSDNATSGGTTGVVPGIPDTVTFNQTSVNGAETISLGGDHLWLAGVDDMWWGRPDLNLALDDVPAGAAVVLLCHNPDFAEARPDGRVGLMLSGHTHGGQVYIRGLGSRWMPSRYGDKYRHGLVQGPASSVYISRGLGEAGIPLRVNAPPEVCLLTLTLG